MKFLSSKSTNLINCKTMEDLLLSIKEHKLLRKYKKNLETLFSVKICIPYVEKYDSCSNDIFFASISGDDEKIIGVKNFLKNKVAEEAQMQQAKCSMIGDIPVITVSGSDSDEAVAETNNKANMKKRKKKQRNKKNKLNASGSFSIIKVNENCCHISNTNLQSGFIETEVNHMSSSEAAVESGPAIDFPKDMSKENADDSIIILSEVPRLLTGQECIPEIGISEDTEAGNQKNKDDSIIILSENLRLPTAEEYVALGSVSNDMKASNYKNRGDGIVLSEVRKLPAAKEFIPLGPSKDKKKRKLKNQGDRVNVLTTEGIPRPIPKMRKLRPIVIDGSNVAREHGKVQNTFSCKGIQLSVEYFLKRGHTQVTAFVPLFRKFCKMGIETTDQPILEELAKTQRVVFTPSRRLNGKNYACHDDGFIVDLASKIDGVILSNDNFREFLDKSPEIKKTIEERLLMFCFVGDILMIPNDPLGRHGPKLDDFLSMDEAVEESTALPTTSLSEIQYTRTYEVLMNQTAQNLVDLTAFRNETETSR